MCDVDDIWIMWMAHLWNVDDMLNVDDMCDVDNACDVDDICGMWRTSA